MISGMRRGFVDEEAVSIRRAAEHLAVIRHHDDDYVVEAAVGAKRIDQAADLGIGAAISAS
jgi:hypothetical protein